MSRSPLFPGNLQGKGLQLKRQGPGQVWDTLLKWGYLGKSQFTRTKALHRNILAITTIIKNSQTKRKKKSQTNRFPSAGLMIFWEAWISKVRSCATWSTKGWYSWLSRLLTWWLMTMFYPLWLACGFQSIFFCTGEHGSPKRHLLTKSFGGMMFRTVLPLELLLLKPQLQLLEALSLRDI